MNHTSLRANMSITRYILSALFSIFFLSNSLSTGFLLKVPGADDNTILIPVLDDTGSTYLEIFETDRAALQILPALSSGTPAGCINNCCSTCLSKVIALTAKLLDRSYGGIGDWVDIMAAYAPGPPTRDRCSGMFVRKSLFTATAPNRQGLLHVSEKNGIARHLPVV
jgi:hypothetical protein